jgi:hypothetical protein
MQSQVTGDLENYVSDKENTRGKSKLGGCQTEILVHSVRPGEGNRCPDEIVDEEHQGARKGTNLMANFVTADCSMGSIDIRGILLT